MSDTPEAPKPEEKTETKKVPLWRRSYPATAMVIVLAAVFAWAAGLWMFGVAKAAGLFSGRKNDKFQIEAAMFECENARKEMHPISQNGMDFYMGYYIEHFRPQVLEIETAVDEE